MEYCYNTIPYDLGPREMRESFKQYYEGTDHGAIVKVELDFALKAGIQPLSYMKSILLNSTSFQCGMSSHK